MKNKFVLVTPRINSWSEDQTLMHQSNLESRRYLWSGNQSNKVKMALAGSVMVVSVVVVVMVSVEDIADLIYSPQNELSRQLATATSNKNAVMLHLDERYAFDGTHSDFAQQFYRRYLAGDEVAKITDTRNMNEVVDYVREFGLEFSNLPAILQQAVVWDMGYVAAADLGYVKVYTKCGIRMSELQLVRNAYRSVGCTEQRCSSPNGEIFYQSMYCSGYQMGNVSLCATTNGITPVHGAMWADGGTDDMVPISEMQRHEWIDAGVDYTIMAIHLSGDPNSYGKCVMPSMIVPCGVYDANTADENDWCSPEHGEIVPQWLELEKAGSGFVVESSGWQKAALPVTITSLVVLLFVLIAFYIFWRKTREQQLQTEDLLEQKRAILGGRHSDEFSMMDDIDFILEAPCHSFIEKGDQQQTWVAWGYTPAKVKQIPTRSVLGEDLDLTMLRGSFKDVPHHQNLNTSKATTAGLTSFASGVTGTPRNSQTLAFTYQSNSADPASPPSSSRVMISSLLEFQSDPKVASRRVPFVDVSLVRQIASGAYGEVWLGRMRSDIVAVKRLTHERRRQLHDLEIFAAEIRLMASLTHSNVLGLLGVAWNTLENLLLITEYMERGDLQYVLQYHSDKGQTVNGEVNEEFSWASHKAKIARDITSGLDYLHSLKPTVVHRDLKSKNVLISNNYEAKLSDFGVSRVHQGEETMTSGVGTAYWTAPEVLAGHKYSEKADVYSLGVVLAELDTGELPFYNARTSDGDKMEAIHILSLVVCGELQPSFTLDCPEDVRELALACLNPKPECRPSAKEVLDELNRLLESDETSLPDSTKWV
ncbi:TKL protein kinase [Phytophthora palmivora]|uniref:TKL protein kinase n=1 Tax=Phytophthora palmivora TaxID=4796 RepID=A0A2P4XTQ6_9STRA|nr:TKL protein kinase [Phytophthora palmivora]